MQIKGAGNGCRLSFVRIPISAKVLAPIVIVAVAIFGWNYYDVMWWIQWYRIVETHGITGLLRIYDLCVPPECKVPYPPLAVLVFISIYAPITYVPLVLRIVILKTLLVIVPGIIVYKVLKEVRDRSTALLWLLCIPFLQIVLALQFDVLIALFVLLSTCMVIRNRVGWAAIYLALATTVKHVLAVIAPLQIAFIWLYAGLRHVARYLATYLLVVGLIVMPFFVLAPRGFTANLITFHSARVPQDLSLWAISTLLLEEKVSVVQPVIDNVWAISFAVCYALLIVSLLSLAKRHPVADLRKLLPLYTSVALLLYIALNKVGNLNYLVWCVPTAFMILNRRHSRYVYVLTAVAGAVCALVYTMMFYAPPAAINTSMFIAEDLVYWNAKALIAQSINHYIFYPSPYIHALLARFMPPSFTPTDFVSEVPLFGYLYRYRVPIMLFAITLAQIVLTSMIVLMVKWIKDSVGIATSTS